ncbi:MAG: hypothetical protein K2Q18_08720, partial [Bdellovibrionales bacterium]|nr:hypothetical protein [Bdellovibrionales bacterium]
GFVIVLCHEIGHHLGGYPKKQASNEVSWTTTEGQADYFATSKCARRIFADDDNEAIVAKLDVPQLLSESCQKSFTNPNDINICIRSIVAGKAVADSSENLLAHSLKLDPKIPSYEIVAPPFKKNSIDDNHSAGQCRLNTFLQGSLCDKNLNEKISENSESNGNCSKTNGDQIGLRPDCWFNPN